MMIFLVKSYQTKNVIFLQRKYYDSGTVRIFQERISQ